jgi:hypothetical protein
MKRPCELHRNLTTADVLCEIVGKKRFGAAKEEKRTDQPNDRIHNVQLNRYKGVKII